MIFCSFVFLVCLFFFQEEKCVNWWVCVLSEGTEWRARMGKTLKGIMRIKTGLAIQLTTRILSAMCMLLLRLPSRRSPTASPSPRALAWTVYRASNNFGFPCIKLRHKKAQHAIPVCALVDWSETTIGPAILDWQIHLVIWVIVGNYRLFKKFIFPNKSLTT